MTEAEPLPSFPPGDRRGPFPILRYFSVAALISLLITAIGLGVVYRLYAVSQLKAQAKRESLAFAKVLSYSLYEEMVSLLKHAHEVSQEGEVIDQIDRTIRAQAKYFNAAKVKIYAANGTTVFSTLRSEIGQNQSGNLGVIGALRGEVVSSLVYREQFNAFDRIMENRNLLQTYLPVDGGDQREVLGVFELYSDMTAFLERIRTTERVVIAMVGGILMALYIVLFVIVYRADRTIRLQDSALKEQVREIDRTNLVLEDRVFERTKALEATNLRLRAEINERETAEQELIFVRQRVWQQDKLAAIGRLAAGIVHEYGNPIAALGGLVESAQEDRSGKQLTGIDRTLSMIRDQIHRLESITRDVSEFSISEASEPGLIDLNEVVTRLTKVMQYDTSLKDFDFDLALDHQLPAVMGIPDQLMQMLMNLVLNAAAAIERKAEAERQISLVTERQSDHAVVIVSDHGIGMDEETMERAFEPFQTTKSPREGLGIGLSLCNAIVQQHGGEIRLSSQLHVGTSVTVSFPLPDSSPD